MPIGCMSAGKSKESKESKDVDKKLKKMKKTHQLTHRIPVVGSGESGKSTLIKQMQILYINGFSDEERREKVDPIRKNIRDGILSVVSAMPKIQPPVGLGDPSNAPHVEYVTQVVAAPEFEFTTEFFDICQTLWADSGVQACYKRSNEYQLIDSADYFISQARVVGNPDYLPSDQDILRCRVLTSGIFETSFNVNKIRFHMFDVGGQQDERRKWVQVLHDVTAVIFVCACSSYDMTLREKQDENRLHEAITLFEDVWNNRFLSQTSIILFLNKQDLFEDKILRGKTKLEDYFPAFTNFKLTQAQLKAVDEPLELARAKAFIRQQFMAISKKGIDTNARRCYPHFTTAVDTENIKRVFADCQDMLQRIYMVKMNML